jgi:Holliday junction resolvasome RuvABC ATP-dependent DNA helicase subunit
MLDRSNVLLRGAFGCGKTELGRYYAHTLDPQYRMHICDGSVVRPPEGAGVVMLDEIHKLKPEEAWYQWPGVIVGATTEGAPISAPMMSRMITVWLEPYTVAEIKEIIDRRCPIPTLARDVVAGRVRGTPRLALQVAQQVSAWARMNNYWPQTTFEYGELVKQLGYYKGGFTDQDRQYLEFLHRMQPASLATIAAGLNMPVEMLRDEIEPFLIRKGIIRITGKGRLIL